ncbi:hypothetical protein [Pontibacillus sp. ALD_SL1]|uniref:hypothetical protein n=1 Tax=Pontibacillus sp. ALD_SL1 TaxID=2777185 RepID=UPI001F6239FD|nr:hypothetical protein [Pontibacillus sp. ALD_SL1]
MDRETYKPEVPEWVAEILEKERRQDPLATHGYTKEWEQWKRKYSRKLKYARQNGWTVEEQ